VWVVSFGGFVVFFGLSWFWGGGWCVVFLMGWGCLYFLTLFPGRKPTGAGVRSGRNDSGGIEFQGAS